MTIFYIKQNVKEVLGLIIVTICLGLPVNLLAAEYSIFVQPVQSEAQTKKAFAPLAKYLADATGHKFTIKTTLNFVSYWSRMRRQNEFDLVLDAAHFTDYRIKKYGYEVLAKFPDTVSFSLITDESTLLFDAEELIGKKVASAPSPSLGGVRLAEMYPNVLRQPVSIPTNNFADALEKVRKKQIVAALVPTPLINGDSSVNTVMTTQPVPHMGLSASSKVDKKVKSQIRRALVNAHKTQKGQEMLRAVNIAQFETTSASEYDGYASLLQDVWGF
jgi:hypothetical protein